MASDSVVETKTSAAQARFRIAVCGGGAAAVLILQALKHTSTHPADVTIFEPRDRLGAGLAYSTSCEAHLLNTRACNMSVTGDQDDFVRWLRTERRSRVLNWTGEDFAPRSYFADYLQERLADLRSARNLHISWVRSAADSVTAPGRGWEVIPAQGDPVVADVVIIATGNEAPRSLGIACAPSMQRLIIEDPWDSTQKAEIPRAEPVLLVGTGLTAVDIATELLQGGHSGAIIAVSRRGLIPRAHGRIAAATEGLVQAAPTSLRALVPYVRRLSADDTHGAKWRRVFTELRSMAPSVWRSWSLRDKKRFLRHVRPFWEVHRHRLPPRVHARIAGAISSGRLSIVKGHVAHVEPRGPGALRVSVRYARGTQEIDVARIVNCTGSELNPERTQNPLLQALIGDRIGKADATGLGLAVDADSRLIGANGSAQHGLYAIGSLTRGARWEVTSIPELRSQANALVRHLLAGRPRPPPPQ